MTALMILERVRDYPERIESVETQLKISQEAVAMGSDDPELLRQVEMLATRILRINRERTAELAAATKLLKLLPPTTARALNRFYVKGQSYGQISDLMKISVSYARKLVGSGRKVLASLKHADVIAMLPDWYFEEDVK